MNFNKFKKSDIFILFIIMLIAGTTAIILGKDSNADLKHYHYYNGYAFLNGRLDYDISPADVMTYLNPLLDVPVYLGITYFPPRLFGFLLGAIQGIGIWLVYKLTRSIIKDSSEKASMPIAILSSITAFLGVGWFSEIGATLGDNIVSLFVLSALLLTISCTAPITLSNGKRALIGAGFLLGFGTGIKLIAGSYFLGYFFSLFLLMDKRQYLRNYIVVTITFLSGMLASIGFWMVKLWDKFQSPIFPYYNKIFRSPYFDLTSWTDARFYTNNVIENLFYPIFFTLDPQRVCERYFLDFRLLTLYLAVLLYSIWSTTQHFLRDNKLTTFRSYDRRKDYFLVTFCVVSYISWQISFPYYRYAISLEMLTPVVIVMVLGSFGMSELNFRRITYAIFVFLIITGITKPINWGRSPWENGLPWDDRSYFSVISTGSLAKYENSTIIMADDADSYVIPLFPEHTKFVHTLGDGINSYMNSNYKNTEMINEVKREIDQSRDLKILLNQSTPLIGHLKIFDKTDPIKGSVRIFNITEQITISANIFNIRVNLDACDYFMSSIGDRFIICDASK